MTVSATSPINNTTQTTATTDTTSAGRNRLAENFDMFLTLLTTQMKNQDPTSPMDSTQFMSQLVQMTGVEQQLAGNDLLKQLVSNTSTSLANVVDMIGKEVRATTNAAGLANGQAKWGYSLPANASDLKIEVLDSNGVPVRTLAGSADDMKAGEHTFVWDGKDATGAKQPDGTYTLRVTAADSANKTIASTIFVQGLVSGVEQQDGQGYITVNGAKVALGTVTSIVLPSSSGGANTNTNTNTTTTAGGDTASGSESTNTADQTSA